MCICVISLGYYCKYFIYMDQTDSFQKIYPVIFPYTHPHLYLAPTIAELHPSQYTPSWAYTAITYTHPHLYLAPTIAELHPSQYTPSWAYTALNIYSPAFVSSSYDSRITPITIYTFMGIHSFKHILTRICI